VPFATPRDGSTEQDFCNTQLPRSQHCDTMQTRNPILALPMPRRNTTDRLDLLRRKRDQLDAQLKALEARNKQAQRKADTRRKVIAGALALEHFTENRDSEFGRKMFRLLDEYVLRPYDRALFDFLPPPDLVEPQAQSPGPGADFGKAGREAGSNTPAP
jgi:hypothetical protein